jgi:PKD repeat protein
MSSLRTGLVRGLTSGLQAGPNPWDGEEEPPPDNDGPTAAFSSVVTGLSVQFTDESTDSDGTIVAWEWDFGDGQTSTEQNPVHVYVLVGTYTVTLTVTDNDAAEDDVQHDATAVVGRDGPSNWYVPQTAAQFTALGLAAPDWLYLCQEASGDLAPTIGAISLVAAGTGHLYQQSVTGWTRKFVGLDGATSGQAWRTTNAALDVGTNESFAMVVYASHASTGNRAIFVAQGANDLLRATLTTGLLRTLHNNVGADGAIDHANIAVAHQLCWYRNCASSASGAVSELEAIAGTHNGTARAGQVRGLGPQGATACPSARYGFVAIYKGTNAERDWAAYLTALRG